jgi:hypothetical protein
MQNQSNQGNALTLSLTYISTLSSHLHLCLTVYIHFKFTNYNFTGLRVSHLHMLVTCPAHLVSADFIFVMTLRDKYGTKFVAPYLA